MKPYDTTTTPPKKGDAFYINLKKLFDGQGKYGRSLTQKRVIGRCKKSARQDGKNTIKESIND